MTIYFYVMVELVGQLVVVMGRNTVIRLRNYVNCIVMCVMFFFFSCNMNDSCDYLV